jgi:colanic acid/amylovoran biosynthesis glycosyltransferase
MHNQIVQMHPLCSTHVVCQEVKNLESFGVPNLHVFEARVGGLLGRVQAADLPLKAAQTSPARYLLRKIDRLGYRIFQRAILRRTGAHVFHSHFGTVGWRDSRMLTGSSVKHVVTFYGRDVNFVCKEDPRWRSRYRKMFPRVAAVFCEGPHMARRVVELGCRPEKVFVQHLGVDVSKINFQPRKRARNQPLKVLIAGSFREKKGIPFALAALGQIQHDIPLEVTVIGDASNASRHQEERRRILSMVEKYSLQDKVTFLGFVSHERLIDEAYRHHIFLSPSVEAVSGDTEGGAPVTILEMMATGMPVVSTTHCDIPELVQHGVTGLLAEERDVLGLVNHLSWLAANEGRWLQMGKAARQRVETEFDARLQGRRQVELYANLLESDPSIALRAQA